VTEAGTR